MPGNANRLGSSVPDRQSPFRGDPVVGCSECEPGLCEARLGDQRAYLDGAHGLIKTFESTPAALY
jgi:hypothetical protein